MTDHKLMSEREDGFASRHRAEHDRVSPYGGETGQVQGQPLDFQFALLGRPNLHGRGNSSTRAQVLLNMQRIHGNRAVQRQVEWPKSPSGYYERDEWPRGYSDGDFIRTSQMYERERKLKLTIPELVQEHIAQTQAQMSVYESEQARKHDMETDDAQRALTTLPPHWAYYPDEGQGISAKPRYDDVSPVLTPWELQEAEKQREIEDSMR